MRDSRGRFSNSKADVNILLKKKKTIRKWILQGLTMDAIADKLGVSSRWLFYAFKDNAELDEMRKEALDARQERVYATAYQLAVGDYKTKIKKRVSSYSESANKSKDENDTTGKHGKNTTYTEEVREYRGAANVRMLELMLAQYNMNASRERAKIDDTISPSSQEFTFIDVSKPDGDDDSCRGTEFETSAGSSNSGDESSE